MAERLDFSFGTCQRILMDLQEDVARCTPKSSAVAYVCVPQIAG